MLRLNCHSVINYNLKYIFEIFENRYLPTSVGCAIFHCYVKNCSAVEKMEVKTLYICSFFDDYDRCLMANILGKMYYVDNIGRRRWLETSGGLLHRLKIS